MPDYIGDIEMRSGDQMPLLAVAVETDLGQTVSLVNAKPVVFILTHQDGKDPRATPVNPRLPQLVLPGFVTDPAAGIVTYDWNPADSLRPGVIEMVVVAVLPDGTITAPTDRVARIIVRPDPVDIFGGTVPGRYDMNLYRGDSRHWRFRLWQDPERSSAVNLTDVSVSAEIRDRPGGTILVPMTCNVTLPNEVDVILDVTGAKYTPPTGAWDLQLTWLTGEAVTAVAGNVVTEPDVTDSLFGTGG